jgi:hypothetical protein
MMILVLYNIYHSYINDTGTKKNVIRLFFCLWWTPLCAGFWSRIIYDGKPCNAIWRCTVIWFPCKTQFASQTVDEVYSGIQYAIYWYTIFSYIFYTIYYIQYTIQHTYIYTYTMYYYNVVCAMYQVLYTIYYILYYILWTRHTILYAQCTIHYIYYILYI